MKAPEKHLAPVKVKSPSHPHAVAIVEDDDNLRKSLQLVFGRCRDLRVAGAYRDAESALRNLVQCAPDLVLMDIDLPGISGIDCLQMVKAVLPETRVMMVTGFDDDERLFQSLMSGADGYLLKPMDPHALLEAVRGLFAGRAAISQRIARRMIDFFQQAQGKPAVAAPWPAGWVWRWESRFGRRMSPPSGSTCCTSSRTSSSPTR